MANGTLSEEVKRRRLAEQWSPAADEIDQEDVDLENEPEPEELPTEPELEEPEPEEPSQGQISEPAPVQRRSGYVRRFEDDIVPPAPAPAPPAEPLGPPTKFLGEEGVDITPTPPKIEPAAPAAPEAGFLGEQGVDVIPTPPKVQPGEAVIKPEKPLPPAKPLEPEPEPEVDIPATSYRPGRGGQEPQYIVLHSSDGHEKGDINTLTQGNVSSHYYTTKDGRSMHFVPEADTAHHAGRDRYGGDGNPYTIGIEQEHIDGEEEWSDDQVRATARTVASIMRRHPNIPIENVIGHADLAGERKQDPLDFPWDTFRKYVRGYLGGVEPREAAREEVAAAKGRGYVRRFEDDLQTTQVESRDEQGNVILTPVTVEGRPDVTRRARPAGQSEYGYYPGEKREDFVYGTVTTFGDEEDRRRYADARAHGLSEAEARAVGDNGQGAASVGGLYTPDTYGVAIPHEVLVAQFGNNYAAMRRARVDIVTPDGRRLRVPIVDVGPGAGPQAKGVAADLTPKLAAQVGTEGKFAFKIVAEAGADVNKDPHLWNSEQSAIAQGIDLSGVAKEHQRFAPQQVAAGKAMTDEELAKAAVKRDEAMTHQHDIITKLPEADKSPVQLYKRLGAAPVEGVSDAFRRQYRDQVKIEITKEAQSFYNEPDPQKAFERATSDANFLTVGEEMGRKLMAFYGQVDVGINQAAQSIDTNRLDQFARIVNPEATPEQRAAFIKEIIDIKDPTKRAQSIAIVNAGLEPVKQYSDIVGLVDSADRIADPEYQRQQNAAITQKKTWIEKQLQQDPQLKGTLGEFVAEQGAQILGSASLAWLPPGIRESAFAAQIYGQAKDEFRRDHPDWTEQQINDAAGKSAFLQLAPQEVVSAAIGGRLGSLTGGIGNPVARVTSAVAAHMGVGTAGGVLQQIGANIAAERDWKEGIPEAAALAAIQSVPGGVIAGVTHPPVGRRPTVPAEERPPVTGERPPVVEERPVVVEERPPVVAEERPVVVEERPPVAEERPVVPERPEEHPLHEPEEQLNKANQDLFNRYEVQGKIEERLGPADIRERELQLERERLALEQERIGPVPEPVREDLGARPPIEPSRREPVRGEEVVRPELGRVPGALETKLSNQEKLAFQPELEALHKAPRDYRDAEFQGAYRAMREKVIGRFSHILDAMGVRRRPDTEGMHFAAGLEHDGRLRLDTHLENGARLIESRLNEGIDPVDYLHSVLQEELAHFAKHLVSIDQYSRTGGAAVHGNIGDFQRREHRRILEDSILARDEARVKGQTKLANDLEAALHHSLPLYKIRGEEISRQQMETELQGLRTNPDPDKLNSAVHELVRQLVQIRSGNPLTESYFAKAWNHARRWYMDALRGLQRLAARLGPGRSLAKTELSRTIRAVENKIRQIDRLARKGIAPEAPSRISERLGRIAPEAPGRERERKISLREAIIRAKLGYSTALKGGESAMLDYVPNLARAIRRKPSLIQAYGQRGRLAQLVQAFQSIPARERARVTREWTDYIRAEQTRAPLPAVGADTMRLLNARKDTAAGIGQLLKELNVHVKDSKGRVRPVRLIGDTYYPWRISDDMRDVFNNRDGNRSNEFNKVVEQEIAAGNVKSREEFVDKFTHAINGDPHSNDHFGNVERARELRLPYSFYDFSPEAFLRYAGRATDRLAQIGAFGQKLSAGGKDMFDLSIENVNARGNLSHEAKEKIIDRIVKERNAEFAQGPRSTLDRLGSLGRTTATGLMLSNPQTSFMNFVSGAAQNMVFGGPTSFAKTAIQFPFGWKKGLAEARDRNILRANLRNVMDDYDLVTNPNWIERGVRKGTEIGLKLGGQDLTESINRVFAMQQAKEILREFTREYGVKDNPISRARNEFVSRRFGFKHGEDATRSLTALAREGGIGQMSDEFIRQYVMDVHGNYGPGQSPAHLLNSPVGKVMFQFQKWGANTSRMMTREYLMPLARAMKSGSMADKGYHILRTLSYFGVGAGLTMPAVALLNALYRRDPKDPTLAEIGKAFSKGDMPTALSYSLKKAYGSLLLSGFGGLFGNYIDMIQNTLGHDPSGRLKDPLHPPAWGVLEPFFALYQGWRGEGGAIPSPQLMDTFARKLVSPYRVGKQLLLGAGAQVASSLGIKIPFSEEYAATNDRNFARTRISMYEQQNPVLREKAEAKGTQQAIIQMAGRSPFSPIRDRIVNGLLAGHPEDVNSAIRDWLTKIPIEQRKAEYDRIKSTISANNPMKVGGSSKPEAVMEFLSWAHDNLPEGEARRIFALAQTYAKTAIDTGLEEKSKGFHQLTKLDYDKFKAPVPRNAPTQAARQAARAAAQGRQLMAELARRQRVAEQLRARTQ